MQYLVSIDRSSKVVMRVMELRITDWQDECAEPFRITEQYAYFVIKRNHIQDVPMAINEAEARLERVESNPVKYPWVYSKVIMRHGRLCYPTCDYHMGEIMLKDGERIIGTNFKNLRDDHPNKESA